MQHKSNPVRLAETLARTSTPVFGLFHRRQVELAAVRRLSAADFYTAYYPLFVFSLFLALLAQVASLISAYGYFEGVLSVKLNVYVLTIAASIAVLLLEVAKYFVMNRVFADLFRLAGVRIPYGLAVVAVAISALSVWASVQGGGYIAVNPQAIAQAIGIFMPFFEQTLNMILTEGKSVSSEKTTQPLPQHLSELIEADRWQHVQAVLKEEGLLSGEGTFIRSRDWTYADFFAFVRALMDKQTTWKRLLVKEQFAILQNTFGDLGGERNYYMSAVIHPDKEKRIHTLIGRISP